MLAHARDDAKTFARVARFENADEIGRIIFGTQDVERQFCFALFVDEGEIEFSWICTPL